MRIASLISIASLCAATGAFISLYLGGDAVFDMQLWKMVLQGIWNAPGAMVREAIAGPESSFFRLVMTVVGGAAIAVLSVMIGALQVKVTRLAAQPRAARKTEKPAKPRNDQMVSGRPAKDRAGRVSRRISPRNLGVKLAYVTGWVRGIMTRRRGGKFRDSAIDLEQSQRETKSLGFGPAIMGIRRKIFDLRKTKRRVVLAAGSEHESVIEIVEDLDFGEDLKAWQERAKRKEGGEAAVIAEARLLSKRASSPMRKKIADEDGVSGEVRLQLLDAWAKRDPNQSTDIKKELLEHQGDDAAVYFKAIKAASEMALEVEDPVDDSIWNLGEDREFVDDLDEDPDEDGETDADDEAPIPAPPADEGAEPFDDQETSASVEDTEPDMEEDLSVELLADGNGEVTPETSDVNESADVEQRDEGVGDDAKVAQIEETIDRIVEFEIRAANVADFKEDWGADEATGEARKEKLEKWFCELQECLGSGVEKDQINDRARTWIDEHMTRFEEEKARLIGLVNGFGENVGLDDGPDIESGFGLGASVDVAKESEPPVDDVTFEEKSGAEAEDAPVPIGIEEDKVEHSSSVGADLGIPELDEIEMSDDIIFKWGYVVKTAGAADARIGHVLLVKNGLQRRVVGVIHLYARWRGTTPDDTKWLNVILRYLPEGDWHLEDGEGAAGAIKMMDSKGNFVQLSDEMAELLQGEGNRVVVHFHGPGADPKLFAERGNVTVTGSVLDAERITEKMS